jgi:hypothetical protein
LRGNDKAGGRDSFDTQPALRPKADGGSPCRPVAGKAEPREADQHHRPSGRLGDRAADGEVEAKAARPVSDKRGVMVNSID